MLPDKTDSYNRVEKKEGFIQWLKNGRAHRPAANSRDADRARWASEGKNSSCPGTWGPCLLWTSTILIMKADSCP